MREMLGINFPRKIGMRVSLIVLCLALTVSVTNVFATRYYTGYLYYGYAGSPPANGVRATIYTINKEVIDSNFYCEWPTVALSYTYGYWIQVGYNKGYDSNYQLYWYTERYDSNGYNIYWHGQPTAGSTYNYYIERSTGSSTWTLGVDSQFSRNITPSPYSPVDYQALTETTTSDIDIDGTHFTSLQTKSGNDWNSWNTHYAVADLPYTITQTSNTEFYGWR